MTTPTARRAGLLDAKAGTTPPSVVDSHVHFWDRGLFDYAWLDGTGDALSRDFLPEDLAPELAALGQVENPSLVFVQADCRSDQGTEEVEWVHRLASSGAPVLAVVAHAPLENGNECEPYLLLLKQAPLVTGVRRLLQDEPPGFVAAPALTEGVRLLAGHGLVMDLCVRQHQLWEVIELVDRCPEVLFVLDHLGKPQVTREAFQPWAAALTRLAARANVRCKLSGLLSEATPRRRTPAGLRPWLEHAIGAFGADRCMFGSDWPVVTAAGGYRQWFEIVVATVDRLPVEERTRVLSGTAAETYDPVNRAARAKDACRGSDG